MRFDTLDMWLNWQESLHFRGIDLGLDRIYEVAKRLGIDSGNSKVVTVAGTNGKGSCIATLSALMAHSGLTYGAYTSPHLVEYNERIRLNGEMAEDTAICEAFQRIDEARGKISLTYFEFATLAAFDLFQRANLDVWLLEIGLGGRLDAVNIIDADVSIVTSVGIDHEAFLGSDREVIGFEKAGVYRPGKPAICADRNPPESLLSHIKDIQAEPFLIKRDFDFEELPGNQWRWQSGIDIELQQITSTKPQLPLPSVAAALQAYRLLGFECSILETFDFSQLQLTGRYQKIQKGSHQFILDVAHNPQAAEHLVSRLQSEESTDLYFLLGMMADKDIKQVVEILMQAGHNFMCVDLDDVPRAASARDVADIVASLGGQVEVSEDVDSGINALTARAGDRARIVILGSFFTVAKAIDCLNH